MSFFIGPIYIKKKQTFENGIFPEILKTAQAIPIFKIGDQQDSNNY